MSINKKNAGFSKEDIVDNPNSVIDTRNSESKIIEAGEFLNQRIIHF